MNDIKNNNYSIRVKNLNKSYGNLKAVDNISFGVKSGEIFGFLGPNGAGKTTTSRMITGVFPPDSGEIYIKDHNLLKQTLEAKMKMGVVPELANAYMDLTARENILFMAEMYGLSGKEVEKKAESLLEKFGLADRKYDELKQFSKGMTQRVVICMALINDPKILFLDEPTSGLDVQSRRLIRNEIRNLNQKGTTISLLVILVGILVLGGTISNLISLIFTVILGSLGFAGLGSIFSALPTDKPANVMMLSNLVRLPVIFISGVFVPVSSLPGWGKIISRLSPVTYVTDLMRFNFGHNHFFTVKTDYIILTLFTFLFLLMAIHFHKRTMIKRI